MFYYSTQVVYTFCVCETVRVSSPTPEPDSVPDPFEDADSLEELEEEIVVLAAHLDAGAHQLLTLVADFDRRRGWEMGGHRSCAQWLAFRTSINLGVAREKVRAARALSDLPETSASMSRGELSLCMVRALTVTTGCNLFRSDGLEMDTPVGG